MFIVNFAEQMATNEDLIDYLLSKDRIAEFSKYNEASLGQLGFIIFMDPYDANVAAAYKKFLKRYFSWAKRNGIVEISGRNLHEFSYTLRKGIHNWKCLSENKVNKKSF